jgi:hypothetical protein
MGASPFQLITLNLDQISSSTVVDEFGSSTTLDALANEGYVSAGISSENLSSVINDTTAKIFDEAAGQTVEVSAPTFTEKLIETYKISERVDESKYKKAVDSLSEDQKEEMVTMSSDINTTFSGGTAGNSDSSISDREDYSSDISTKIALDVKVQNKLIGIEMGPIDKTSFSIPFTLPSWGVDFGYFSFKNQSADLIGTYGSESFTLGQYAGTNATNFNSKLENVSKKVLGSVERLQCTVMGTSKHGDLLGVDGLHMAKLAVEVARTPVIGKNTVDFKTDVAANLRMEMDWDPAIESSVSIVNGIVSIITAPFKLLGSLLTGFSKSF